MWTDVKSRLGQTSIWTRERLLPLQLASVAWRFCRAGRTSGEAAGREIRARSREKVAPALISSRFLCPRPPLLLSAPKQNRHATQATLQSNSALRTRLIRTRHYYGQFALYLGKENPYIFSKFILLNTNTPLIRIPSSAPSVSVVTEFDCTCFFRFLLFITSTKNYLQVVYQVHP